MLPCTKDIAYRTARACDPAPRAHHLRHGQRALEARHGAAARVFFVAAVAASAVLAALSEGAEKLLNFYPRFSQHLRSGITNWRCAGAGDISYRGLINDMLFVQWILVFSSKDELR